MDFEYCPRCGTKRPDALKWCRRCGLDFEKAAKGKFPPGTTAPPSAPPGGWATDRLAQVDPRPATPIDVRQVNDRRNLARWTASALEVRCGGTAGGCLGIFAGFIVGGYLGAAAGGVAPILLIPLFVVIGMFAGMRIALRLMSR